MTKVAQAISGILWFILGIAILTKTHSWFTTLATIFEYTYVKTIYWIALITLGGTILIIIPLVLTVDAFQN